MKLIIYSGGMDSTVLLHDYRKDIGLAVSFDYGSKHNNREYASALINTRKIGIDHLRIPLQFIAQYFKSDLLKTGGDIPYGHYEDKSMIRTVVPFRNGIMLSIAVGLAESHGLDGVLIANHAGDHAIYPDCRSSFIGHFKEAAIYGTYAGIQILSPYIFLSKRQIALKGQAMGISYSETYSCYEGEEIHCGRCGTCVERREALQGFDPTNYKE
jgi:7-cyano-7-deazaguanine synthase